MPYFLIMSNLRAFVFCCFLPLISCQKQKEKKPNIILVMADDMGHECITAYGNREYNTPAIDKMAREGITFQHCYSQPLCTPSRVKIMTGKYNYRNYVEFGYLDRNDKTFGNLLKDAGYNTCIAGKWQLNGISHKQKFSDWNDKKTPYKFGFDTYCLWQLTEGKRKGERFANPLIIRDEEKLQNTSGKYGPDIFADFIIDFIDKNKENPFFVYYPMVLVHDPFVPTPDSQEWSDTSLRYNNDTSYFADMMAYTDKIMGRIIDKIESEGLSENTLIIFTGDNGTHKSIFTKMQNGEVIQGGKGQMNDYGTRVPFMAKWKGTIPPGTTTDALINFSDIYPTFASLAGISISSDSTDGYSLNDILRGSTSSHPTEMFMHYAPRWGKFESGQFARNRAYKLYRNGEFYHVAEDPEELNNLQWQSEDDLIQDVYHTLNNVMQMHPKINEKK